MSGRTNVIARSRLEVFWKDYPDSEQALRSWYAEASKSDWNTPHDIKDKYRNASFVGGNVVFNICGNKYRLIVNVDYQRKKIYIKFIGTHVEYDKLDAENM